MVKSKTETFIKGISVQTIVTIFIGVLELIVFSTFSRLLSKEEFGYFAAMMGVMAISQSLSEAGLGSSIIQKREASPKFISTACSLSLIMGCVIALLVFVLAPQLALLVCDDTITIPLRIMSSTLILNSLISVGNAQLYRKLNFKRVGIIRCISFCLAGMLGLYLAYVGWGLLSIVAYTTLDPLLNTFFLYTTSVKFPRICVSKDEIKGIVSYGGWLTIGVIINNLTKQIDKLFTSRLLSVEVLGAYNRPAGFTTNITSKITSIFDNVLFPMLSNLQDDHDKVIGVFYRSVSLLNSISIVLFAIFFFNAPLIITIFFGSAWMDMVVIMRIVSLTVIFYVNGQLVDCYFRSLNLVKQGTFLRFFNALLTVCCVVIGCRYGVIGLAIGVVISNIVNIVSKLFVLVWKIKASLSLVIEKWIIAWKPSILLIIVGCIFFIVPSSLPFYIIEATIFAIILILEFIFYPNIVGTEYTSSIYPHIKNKIKI